VKKNICSDLNFVIKHITLRSPEAGDELMEVISKANDLHEALPMIRGVATKTNLRLVY
jgi:hypothetical protein